MMLLIADSGTTKTDWRLIDPNDKITPFQTSGINPFYYNKEQTKEIIEKDMLPFSKEKDMKIFFYGAGCSSDERCNIVEEAIQLVLPHAEVYIEHDLLGAARALCGKEKGIATILGTGSNSCHYNGEDIVMQIGGYGFILGDEGSGTYLGKRLLRAFLYDAIPEAIQTKFTKKYQLQKSDITNTVYGKADPPKFLASFAPFLSENLQDEFIQNIVYECFNDFFDKHILKYKNYKNLKLYSLGSIAYYFSDILKQVSQDRGMHLEKIIKKPIDELVQYHIDTSS